VGLDLSIFSAKRTILLLTRSGIHFRHCFCYQKTVSSTSTHHSVLYSLSFQFGSYEGFFGTPTVVSVMCCLCETRPSFWPGSNIYWISL